ncbi:MAG: PD-(D/E)XK nuclease family protein, partial [Oceanococcus sp.]
RVGTWPDLLAQVRSAYLLDETEGWSEALHELLAERSKAFWHASYQVDPQGVAQAVEAGWRQILLSQSPNATWPEFVDDLRIGERLADLNLLNSIPKSAWPSDLATPLQLEQGLLPHRPIRVHASESTLALNIWQVACLERLNADAIQEPSNLPQLLGEFEAHVASPRAKLGSRLDVAQRELFSGTGQWGEDDDSCQFITVRDGLESVELVAGLIQQTMEDDGERCFADFGLLLPRDYSHTQVLASAFADWGIPLSNLPIEKRERDLGRELVRFALMRFEGPIPSMALKALVTNPLMPWDSGIGIQMAESLESFGFGLEPPKDLPADQRELLALLDEPSAPDQLSLNLSKLISHLDAADELALHRQRAIDAVQAVQLALRAGEADWRKLRSLCSPARLEVESTKDVNLEGVTVIREGEMPWRPVHELFVLDFLDGHYPQKHRFSLVLAPDQWRRLASQGLAIELPQQGIDRQRKAFRLALCQVSERVRFMIPQRSHAGEVLAPCSSLIDFALLAGRADEPEKLLVEFESEGDRAKISSLPLAAPVQASSPRTWEVADLNLGTNLLARSEMSGTSPKPQSPSSLDFLLMCPLAWLLRQLGAEPSNWDPDGFSPMMSGTLAHDVFEQVFAQGTHQPDWNEIGPKIKPAFDVALRKTSPFLTTADWAVERQNLLGVIERAARQWTDLLCELEATVVQPEIWLQGQFDGAAVHGQADAVLSIPDRGVVVVDFKNSSSAKFLNRMNNHLDLQASLYQEMLKTGGPKKREVDAAVALKGLQLTGVVYFTLRDQKASANFQPLGAVAGWRFADHDVSSEGLGLLRKRFEELRAGQVCAPRADAIDALSKAGVPDYALKLSPLTTRLLDESSEGEKA